jgi:hypothetical protein
LLFICLILFRSSHDHTYCLEPGFVSANLLYVCCASLIKWMQSLKFNKILSKHFFFLQNFWTLDIFKYFIFLDDFTISDFTAVKSESIYFISCINKVLFLQYLFLWSKSSCAPSKVDHSGITFFQLALVICHNLL